MQYGSAGAGSTTHLACALLNSKVGVDITHVPYRGGGPAANDLIGGQIDYMCGNLGTSAHRITAKQVKGLALSVARALPLMPDFATAHEQGLTDYDVITWMAFFLPKGTPRAIVDKLNEATHGAMDTPAIKQRMLDIGVTGVGPERRRPEYLARSWQRKSPAGKARSRPAVCRWIRSDARKSGNRFSVRHRDQETWSGGPCGTSAGMLEQIENTRDGAPAPPYWRGQVPIPGAARMANA